VEKQYLALIVVRARLKIVQIEVGYVGARGYAGHKICFRIMKKFT